MVRRLVTFLAALALIASAAGCAALGEGGGDSAEAASILDRATKAQESIESLTFAMTMSGEAAGETFSMQIDGGGYVKGEREGDMVMRMTMNGAGLPGMNFQMVALGGRAFANLGGTWQEIPGGLEAAGGSGQLQDQLKGFDLAKYVKDVKVEKGTTFLGEPVTKIVGTIAIEDLMTGLFDQLGSAGGGLGGLGGAGLGDPSQLLEQVVVDDVRASIYVSDVTNLVRAAHMEFVMEVQGQKATFDIDITIDSVNEPVEIPEPAVVA